MNAQDEAAPTGRSERQGLDGDRVHPHSTRRHYLYLTAPISARAGTGMRVVPAESGWCPSPDDGPVAPCRVAFWVPKGEDAPNLHVVDAILDSFLDDSGDYVEGWELSEDDWQEWPEALGHLRALVFCAPPGRVISSDAVRVILDAHRAGVPVWYLGLWDTLYPLSDVSFRILAAGTPERFASVEVVSWPSGSR